MKLKDVAPSTGLRQWFGHIPARWSQFERRYRAELDANPDSWKPLLRFAQRGTVTLVYAHATSNTMARLRCVRSCKTTPAR